MVYYVRQWGDKFFELTKIRGYDRGGILGHGSKICEADFHRLALHAKMYRHPIDNLNIKRRSFTEITRFRGEGKVEDIIPGFEVETVWCMSDEERLNKALEEVGIV